MLLSIKKSTSYMEFGSLTYFFIELFPLFIRCSLRSRLVLVSLRSDFFEGMFDMRKRGKNPRSICPFYYIRIIREIDYHAVPNMRGRICNATGRSLERRLRVRLPLLRELHCYLIEALPFEVFLKQGGNLANELRFNAYNLG